MNSKGLTHIVAFTLVIVGALNWGLVGLFSINLISAILGSVAVLERLIYIVVGIGAVYLAATHQQDCKTCSAIMKKSAK
ncbi:hypothetical protein A3F02_01980 [Candidatus Curtissbacteria bacterium RIFCSPHIGHO2_12_FULL_38_9b]|uniref:DUF378 domain-containing protein n=2 Tax=Candidatus Curtissiibacteriota TaxID=1752717 RepID=A0A1F5GXW5_9BACT|nr:MAG: hypothetical protein A3A48_00350 [Candidatus Curtissbacteria bacterium RIFCSPLOWO2_01_FULL_37_9]OGD96659.1 MAG: hypothetical protein A3F02_01980 [Candidatus Curtissbacteria bacterium RIFCSPHIGHO2_12_FULL_38_9b]